MAKRTGRQCTVLRQICELIPPHLVPRLARAHGVDCLERGISAWSHVVCLMLAQMTHAIGLNDVCDSARYHVGKLRYIRGAAPCSRNGFSNANRTRDAAMARQLFYEMLDYLTAIAPGFGGRTYKGMPRRFKRTIHVIDTTTIQLVASCMDWAKHRRRKAAAKLHLSLNLQNFLPIIAVVTSAARHEARHAARLCAGLKSGEIALFDKGFIDYAFLYGLTQRGVNFVTRSKSNMRYRVVKRRLRKAVGNILRRTSRDSNLFFGILTGPLFLSLRFRTASPGLFVFAAFRAAAAVTGEPVAENRLHFGEESVVAEGPAVAACAADAFVLRLVGGDGAQVFAPVFGGHRGAPVLQRKNAVRIPRAPAVDRRAGPPVFPGGAHHAGAHGVEFNIGRGAPGVVLVHGVRVEPALPEVALAGVHAVDVLRVHKVGAPECAAQGVFVFGHGDQMHVVRH